MRRIIGITILVLMAAIGVTGDYLSTCAEDSCVVWACEYMGNGECGAR